MQEEKSKAFIPKDYSLGMSKPKRAKRWKERLEFRHTQGLKGGLEIN